MKKLHHSYTDWSCLRGVEQTVTPVEMRDTVSTYHRGRTLGGKVSNPQSDIESRFRTKTIHKIHKQGLISIFCFLPLHPRMLKGSFTYITATCFSSKYTSQRASTLA